MQILKLGNIVIMELSDLNDLLRKQAYEAIAAYEQKRSATMEEAMSIYLPSPLAAKFLGIQLDMLVKYNSQGLPYRAGKPNEYLLKDLIEWKERKNITRYQSQADKIHYSDEYNGYKNK